jgi:hypothetical protein
MLFIENYFSEGSRFLSPGVSPAEYTKTSLREVGCSDFLIEKPHKPFSQCFFDGQSSQKLLGKI